MKVCVDANLCESTGVCADTCPEIFELDDQGMTIVKSEQVPPQLEQTCKEAAGNCPTGAISIQE
jgi:ferredoxin